MASLVCLPPVLADQSFPRHSSEATIIAVALGRLDELVRSGIVRAATTPIFRDLLETYCWDQPHQLKGEIYRYLIQLVTSGNGTVSLNIDGIEQAAPHPLPQGSPAEEVYVQLWSEELGKLVLLHDDCMEDGGYFIGIVCEHAFSGGTLNTYQTHSENRCFPLVSPSSCDCNSDEAVLADADTFVVPAGYSSASISFDEAKQNVHVIGASSVRTPTRGSHFEVEFPGQRTWPLDPNNDPIPPGFLNQLKPLTGFPLAVIKFALKEGRLPPTCSRLKGKYLAN